MSGKLDVEPGSIGKCYHLTSKLISTPSLPHMNKQMMITEVAVIYARVESAEMRGSTRESALSNLSKAAVPNKVPHIR